jgi:hypothetical protein
MVCDLSMSFALRVEELNKRVCKILDVDVVYLPNLGYLALL